MKYDAVLVDVLQLLTTIEFSLLGVKLIETFVKELSENIKLSF